MSQQTESAHSDNGEKAAKGKVAALLTSAIPAISENNINFSPYRNGDDPVTSIYIKADISDSQLEAFANAFVGISPRAENKVRFAKDQGSGSSIEFPGTMHDIANADAASFNAKIAQYYDEQAKESAPVSAILNGDIAPAIAKILEESSIRDVNLDPVARQNWVNSTSRRIAQEVRKLGRDAAQSSGHSIS